MNDLNVAQQYTHTGLPARYVLSDPDFQQFQTWMYDWAGITLGDNKKVLVNGRLSKRLRDLGLNSFSEYIQLLKSGDRPFEKQQVIDLLTTNETYFFRESKHFEFVGQVVKAMALQNNRDIKFWCAASSTGEEPYTLAMVLHDVLGGNGWNILATDINDTVLNKAKAGIYPIEAQNKIPAKYLNKFCLKGIRSQKGVLKIGPELTRKIQFQKRNLNQNLNGLPQFDFVFLRNVLIYFSVDTKREIIERISRVIRPGGYLLIGHSESLHKISDKFQSLRPAVYQRIE
ncbi:MAG: CheR family methyltransferase [Ketobacteraceae bacterium]|nr:CheR family methyltransferase [Ketobacteraceae bacterium]